MHTPATTIVQPTHLDSDATLPIENQNSKIENLLSANALTLLLGDPGVGKSLLAIDLAARLSRGQSLPPIENRNSKIENPPSTTLNSEFTNSEFPHSSLLLSTEDSPSTLTHRLRAANANPDFISLPSPLLSLVPPKPKRNRTPKPAPLIHWLTTNLPQIKNPRLLILDSLPSFLGTHDCSNAATIRKLLHPLLHLAESHNLAILGLTHLNKSTRGGAGTHNALHRALGSLAYPALARSVLLLAPDPDPQNPHRRILSQLKNNLGPLHPPLAFSIADQPAGPFLDWEPDPLPDPATQLAPIKDPFLRSQFDEALHFLTTSLADGPIPSTELLQQSHTLGISPRTLARAKFHLQTHSFHHPDTNQWLTSLP